MENAAIDASSDGAAFADLAMAAYDVGTPYVPSDQIAKIHKGEAIIPAKYNKSGAFGGNTVHNNINISGPVDRRTMEQIAHQVGMSTQRAMKRTA
jgi:hypothetical protein